MLLTLLTFLFDEIEDVQKFKDRSWGGVELKSRNGIYEDRLKKGKKKKNEIVLGKHERKMNLKTIRGSNPIATGHECIIMR